MSQRGIETFDTTVDDLERARRSGEAEARPGLLLLYTGARPMLQPVQLGDDGAIELGRALLVDDERVSRRHARVARRGERWSISDLESRNGTFLEGARVRGEVTSDAARVLRVGGSLFTFVEDLSRFEAGVASRGTALVGPRLRAAYAAIERAAMFGDTLFIRGESGSGKELAARVFHELGGRAVEPFVAVNCAAIPEGLAERLLFGAKKGAYSGALADAVGHIEAANGGTLFLDEVAELDLAVQAKLLRVLEQKEVLVLGDSSPRRVSFRLCSATHRDLRALVAAGRFREDLYFRIGKPEVLLPPLRERVEEIPWHVAAVLDRVSSGLSAHVALVESCLLRHWPGNVRELSVELRQAAQGALAAARRTVELQDLAPSAGLGFGATGAGGGASAGFGSGASAPAEAGAEGGPRERGVLPDAEVIQAALAAEGGNVTRAARRLGLHRNQLRRWLEKQGGGG